MGVARQGESKQAELQKAQEQQQALAARLQETLDQAEKQRQGLEAKLQLQVQEDGLLAILAQDFGLSPELQQRLSAEGEAHAGALQDLRDQVTCHATIIFPLAGKLKFCTCCGSQHLRCLLNGKQYCAQLLILIP